MGVMSYAPSLAQFSSLSLTDEEFNIKSNLINSLRIFVKLRRILRHFTYVRNGRAAVG